MSEEIAGEEVDLYDLSEQAFKTANAAYHKYLHETPHGYGHWTDAKAWHQRVADVNALTWQAIDAYRRGAKSQHKEAFKASINHFERAKRLFEQASKLEASG